MKKLTAANTVCGPYESITHYAAGEYLGYPNECYVGTLLGTDTVIPISLLQAPVVVEDAASTDFLPDQTARKAELWLEIKALRDAKIQSGGYQVAGKWYHSDTFSRTQQIGLVMLGASIPAGLQWKTMDGSFVTMTQSLAAQIFAAAAAQDIAVFARAEVLRAQVNASSDPGSIDITTGWPATYT